MSIIPDFFREATIAVGEKTSSNTVSYFGSGFLVGRYEGKDSKGLERYTVYLVTNKHVIDGRDSIEIQYNHQNTIATSSINLIIGNKKQFSEHQKQKVDVVAISMNCGPIINGTNYYFFSLKDHALDLTKMKATGVGDGSLIYALGFPVGISQTLISNIFNEPIYRLGCIAKIEHLYHPSNTDDIYYIDSNLFPGNSGGPIINRPEHTSITGTSANTTSNLIGVVGAYLPYQDVLFSKQTGRARMVSEENSGLALVYPVETILQTVELERTRVTGLSPSQQIKLP